MTCPHTVGRCPLMRTCPCCKREFGSRAGLANHQRACKQPFDVEYADQQHVHWKENHNHFTERARRRLDGHGRTRRR